MAIVGAPLLMGAFLQLLKYHYADLPQGYINLSSLGDLRPMVRIVTVLLIVGPILDVYVLNGSYTQTAGRILYSAFQHFR